MNRIPLQMGRAVCRRAVVWVALGAICLLGTATGRAGPPRLDQLPAETTWFVHLDVDAVHKSTVCRELTAKAFARWKEAAGHLDKVREQLGLDITKDLHGMTVFGPELSEAKAVLLLRADWDPQTFRKKAAQVPGLKTVSHGPYEIHAFNRDDRGRTKPLAAACWKPGAFVFAANRDEVSRYLDVLDGKRPGLAEKKSALAGDLQPGTILQARMIDVGKSLPVESPLLKQTERIDVACGEDSGRWFLTGRLVARDAEVAEQARKVVDGFLAIVRLQESSDREAVKLLERIQLAVKDRTLEIDFRIEADELVRRVEAIVERFLHRAKK